MNVLRCLFLSIILILPIASYAAHLPDDIEPGDNVNEIQLPLTKESAAELIRLESKGKVLSVDKAKFQGKVIFKIKVLHRDGKIKNYRLDPATGHHP